MKLETLQKLVSGYVETVPSALDATWAREEPTGWCCWWTRTAA